MGDLIKTDKFDNNLFMIRRLRNLYRIIGPLKIKVESEKEKLIRNQDETLKKQQELISLLDADIRKHEGFINILDMMLFTITGCGLLVVFYNLISSILN